MEKTYKSFPPKPDRNKKPANPIFFGCGLVGYRSTEVPLERDEHLKMILSLILKRSVFKTYEVLLMLKLH